MCNLALPAIRGVDKTCIDAGEMLEVYVWVTNCFGRLLSLAGAAIRIIFVATNKHAFLSLQNTSFVTTKVCAIKLYLSRQTRLYCDKHTFVATKDVFCRDKNDTCGSYRQ